jgi:acyl-CoA dehydrogenase
MALTMGGQLKFAEFTSGRFADVLSNLYLGYCVLWYYKKYPVPGAEAMVDFSMQNILCDAEEAFDGIFANFPVPVLGATMKALTFPTGRCYSRPGDKLTKAVSDAITTDSAVRKQFATDLYISKDLKDRIALLNDTLPKAVEVDKIYTKMRKEKRKATAAEQTLIDAVEAAREIIIQVDSFPRLGKELNHEESWSALQRPAYGQKVMAAASRR